jgi:hypothetical protein
VGSGVAVGTGVAVGNGVAVGEGVAVGTGGLVGAAVAVGLGVTPEGAGVSTVMTGDVAVGSAALFGGAVAVGSELGVDVGRMVITRGVGVAVASAADSCNACGVNASDMERVAPRVCTSVRVALSAVGATKPRLASTTAAMIPVTTPCRRVADVTASVTVL